MAVLLVSAEEVVLVIAQIVRFTSAMDDEKVLAAYEDRAPRYRRMPGLLQKYYLAFPSGEHGAVYVWESKQAMHAFGQSDLARSISEVYEVSGDPQVEVCDVVLALHPAAPVTP